MTDTSELRREIRSYTSDMDIYERKDDAIIRIKRQRGKLKRMAMTLLDEIDRLRAENARMREAGDKLAAQTRSYWRGMSGTLPLGQTLNAWDAARAALNEDC